MSYVLSNTKVLYYGSISYCNGAVFKIANRVPERHPGDSKASIDGYRYTLTPVVAGTVHRSESKDYLWNVRRQSFTVIHTEDEKGA